jgi:hypothetical protein
MPYGINTMIARMIIAKTKYPVMELYGAFSA